MAENNEVCQEYLAAISFLPENLRRIAIKLSPQQTNSVEEIRIRIGKPITFRLADGEIQMPDEENMVILPADISRLIENVTRSSIHSYAESLRNGFISVKGGHRLGLCGTAAIKDDRLISIRNFSSANFRIAKEQTGISEKLIKQITAQDGNIQNTIIVSSPGNGKTTLLRDIIRNISNSGKCVGIADERGELASCYMGVPQFDVGKCTDIMDGCPKLDGLEMLIKVMSPEVIAIDEITSLNDAQAVETATHCGVSIIATAHARNAEEFKSRSIYSQLVKSKVFKNIITIEKNEGARKYILSKSESVPK